MQQKNLNQVNHILKRIRCFCLSIFVVCLTLSVCVPVNAATATEQSVVDDTTQQETKKADMQMKEQRTIRVGSFEDTFNYVDKNGVRRGFGYELMQALGGYAGWKFEYVKCNWTNCFDKLENGEIDVMGDISYTAERAQKMLFSEKPMGEENYILYADLSNTDIVTSDFKSLDGKRVGVLMGTEPEIMLTEWENKNGIHTEHVNVSNNDDVEKKLANHEIDGFVSLEESIWSEQGISSVTNVGQSDIYFVINRERSDIKTEMDYAMRQLDKDSPFFKADLYKKYFTLDYSQILTGEEKLWLEEHGYIKIGFLDNDLNAEIAEAILERAGLKIERVEDGIQCVNRIEKMPAGTYDMILMDIQMPNMDGYKAAQVIRHLPDKDKARIPVIAMTANAFEEDKRDAIAAGMDGHIAKPIKVDKLLSMLAGIIRQQETHRS